MRFFAFQHNSNSCSRGANYKSFIQDYGFHTVSEWPRCEIEPIAMSYVHLVEDSNYDGAHGPPSSASKNDLIMSTPRLSACESHCDLHSKFLFRPALNMRMSGKEVSVSAFPRFIAFGNFPVSTCSAGSINQLLHTQSACISSTRPFPRSQLRNLNFNQIVHQFFGSRYVLKVTL